MNNKFKSALLSVILVFGLAGSAYAGPRHGGHYSQRGHYSHRSHDNWGGVAAAVIVTGLIAAAIANSQQQQVEVAPPQPTYSPGGTWYYCASAGQYYPQVGYCPEGWRAVQQ
ncbi:MAG: hypothetical protein H6R18_97 [Proteobacteria bacterium]|nr:hypothetical protein [Pseudomonadota bacterium]